MQGTRQLRTRTIEIKPNTVPRKKPKLEDQHEDANSGPASPPGDDIPGPGRRKGSRPAPKKKTKPKKKPAVKRGRKPLTNEEKILELIDASPPWNERDRPIPPKFLEAVRHHRESGEISEAMEIFYLNLVRGDLLRRAPGTGGRYSVLEDLFGEDAPEAVRLYGEKINGSDEDPSGWRMDPLGLGAYGKFHLWALNREGAPHIRIVAKDATRHDSFFEEYNKEGNLVRRLNDAGCKNVIRVLDWYPVQEKFTTWFEYAEFGDLGRVVSWYKHERLVLPEAFLWHVFYSIANALCYCRHGTNDPHSWPRGAGWDRIIHNFLRHDTILLAAPDEDIHRLYPCLKLNDFGHSYTLGEPRLEIQKWRSTWVNGAEDDEFAAPELKKVVPENRLPYPGETQDSYSDVYGLGVVMAQMCKLADRRLAKPLRKLLAFGESANPSGRRVFSSYYSPELKELIRRCRSLNPLERPPIFSLYLETKTGMEVFRDRTYQKLELLEPPLIDGVPIYHDKVLITPEEQALWFANDEFQAAYEDANLDPVDDLEAEAKNDVEGKKEAKQRCAELLREIDDSIITDAPEHPDFDSSELSTGSDPEPPASEPSGSAPSESGSAEDDESDILPSIE